MSRSAAEARAALGLALALVVAAWPGGPPRPRPCAEPADAGPGTGWTRSVRCGPSAGSAPLRGPARRLFGLGLDPNRADAGTLETLPGIGPARARALLRARRDRRFCGPADLERAEGIGPRLREAIEPELLFPRPCPAGPAGAPSGRENW